MTAARIPAFVNPAAGHGRAVIEALTANGRFAIHEVAPSDLEPAIRRVLTAGARRIVVAGGDGTLCSAAAVLVGTEASLGVIPAGTLNHFARDHDIPLDYAAAADIAAGDVTRRVDVAFVNDRPFLNTSAVGVYITFVRMRDRLKQWCGYYLASLIAGLRLFLAVRTVRVQLEVAGTPRTYDAQLVFLGVGERELQAPTLGGPVPGGRRGLHVIVVQGRSRARIVAAAIDAMMRGTHAAVAGTPVLDSHLLERCKLIPQRRRAAHVSRDGEIDLLTSPLDYRLARDALVVAVPAVPPAPVAR